MGCFGSNFQPKLLKIVEMSQRVFSSSQDRGDVTARLRQGQLQPEHAYRDRAVSPIFTAIPQDATNTAARILQRWTRRRRCSYARVRDSAATAIQLFARRMAARRDVQSRKLLCSQSRAALCIQRAFQCHLARASAFARQCAQRASRTQVLRRGETEEEGGGPEEEAVRACDKPGRGKGQDVRVGRQTVLLLCPESERTALLQGPFMCSRGCWRNLAHEPPRSCTLFSSCFRLPPAAPGPC